MQADQVIGGRYRIVAPIGEGGMANVYKVQDIILDRIVALKIMRLDMRDDPIVQKRFENEIRASTELVHPNITQVYDYGDEDGNQYLVTEYISGPDLKHYEKDNFPLPLTKVVNILTQVLSGIQEAHNHDIIHRDLKPQNILMTDDGTAKITDFGIARAQSSYGMTQTNTAIGSVHYMAPEQVRGEVATPQSDLYSLGIMLYELLTGKVPYDGETSVAVAVKHTTEPMPLVRDSDPRIPQALENVILKATAKNPSERYLSADEMREDLATVLSPDRMNEARWESPSAGENETATKVISTVDNALQEPANQKTATMMTATNSTAQRGAKAKEELPAEAPKNKSKKKRSKKRWLVVLSLLVVAIITGIVVYGQAPTQATVPDINGSTLDEAKKELDDAHLKLGEVTRKNSDAVKSGKIMSVKPHVGEQVNRDSKVDLVVSSGARKIRFGDYRNEAFDSVSEQLKAKGYTITTTQQSSDTVPAGYIIEQDIEPDKKVVPSKTTVNFVISSGVDQTQVPTTPAPQSSRQSSRQEPSKGSEEASSKQESEASSSESSIQESEASSSEPKQESKAPEHSSEANKNDDDND
ncbi:Stk1 family PASTA domain-containing Ser/Thr kinase [Weissella minor]|uniref:non-specific serine/threonine protein kinase n=1 Tax=Weissella minor TaxID=1620 RepID=A0A0R2JG16_9LACO|nr:Stk1 family PASTA domain-containing Ser/Thr kinase [Weissella minor]KRN76291.1 non-specific serine threonine protein kinase [Weissella minor]